MMCYHQHSDAATCHITISLRRWLVIGLVSMAVIVGVIPVMAVRAVGGWMIVTQPDGSSLQIRLQGDEWFSYFHTTDNVPLVRTAEGHYCYADITGFGMRSSGVLAHEALMRTPQELQLVAAMGTIEDVEPYVAHLRKAAQERHLNQRVMTTGQHKGLVILVSFTDCEFSTSTLVGTTSRSFYRTMLNREGFQYYTSPGSVHDYFMQQSGGLFDVTFDVVGPIQVSKGCKEYSRSQVRTELMPEVLRAVDDEVNFADYDWDGDGVVEQVCMVYAGFGANESAEVCQGCIWPHEWTVSPSVTLDGVRISTYACSNELWSDNVPVGMGTFCHEFSHCLGLPDLYNTGSASDSPTGGYTDKWEIMDGGNYSYRGWVPAGYSGFERAYCGWLQPIVLSEPQTITDLQPLNEGGCIYKVVNDCADSSVDEYYLLENRQKTDWDRYLPGHGLLITHVDYNASAWAGNRVNADINHLRLMLMVADNQPFTYYYDAQPLKNAAYPYLSEEGIVLNDALTDSSTPAATVFHPNREGTLLMGQSITAISESADGLISFDFMGGNKTPVGVTPVEETTPLVPSQQYDLLGRQLPVTQFVGRRSLVLKRQTDGSVRKQIER